MSRVSSRDAPDVGRPVAPTTVRSRRTASSPFRRIGWWTVVSGGSTCWARSMSSKPTTLTSPGTSQPEVARRRASRRSPWRRSWPGRRSAAARPPRPAQCGDRRRRCVAGPTTTRSSASSTPAAAKCRAIAAQPARHDALRVASRPRARGGSTPITRTSRWPSPRMCSAAARAPPTSSTSTEPCSGSAAESTSTIGTPAPPDLLDLRDGRRSGRSPRRRRPSPGPSARASEPCSGEMKWSRSRAPRPRARRPR